ncbi:MAG: uroporphyrinogen-III synthase [Proteobacteria bacterium]|nr:uroporphyrinogen-III synthase [Pseudomonadota bacterium]
MRIVLTRPHKDSERTAALLRAHGHDVLIAPLLRIETLPVKLDQCYGAVIVTSANAAAALADHPACATLTALPVFAVGQRSGAAVRAAGFSDIHVAGGDIDDLTRLIAEQRPDEKAPLLYLAGEDRSGDLVGDLAVHGIAVELAVIYRAVPQPFPAELTAALTSGAVDAVMHFSRRSAAQYVTGAQAAGIAEPALGLRHVCLSAQIAEPLRDAGGRRIDVAKRPDESAMMAIIDQLATSVPPA